ncbi:MAG: hypothetical protein KC433_25985 [Anaerolineales bacterium]|nr:hypothetical protein [Anaerolineales bacterium]
MMKRFSLLAVSLVVPLLLAFMLLSAQQIWAGGAPTPDVCAVGCNYSTIQAALNDSQTVGTTLHLAGETFTETIEITRSITLMGVNANTTIINGNFVNTVVHISGNPTVTLSGLSIQNGDTTAQDGGGLFNQGGTVVLSNVVVENNMAPSGGGIRNDGTMSLSYVTVRNNVADEIVGAISVCPEGVCTGGGIFNRGVLTLTFGIVIQGNTAQFGGGIENANNSSLYAEGIEVYGNTAESNPGTEPSAGGGIENLGTLTLANSIVRNNNAPYGAGVANGGTLTVSDSNIYSNIAGKRGGGIHNSYNLTVQTSNVYDNEAGSEGGGGISSESGTVMVMETAVYNNSAQFGGGIIHNVDAGLNSFVITNSTLSGNSATGTGGALRNAGIATTTLNNVTINNNSAIVAAGQSVSLLGGTVTTKNSIISSSGTDCSGTISSNGYNLVSDSSCGLSGTADLVNANPQLGVLKNNGGSTLTHALLFGSPAIDSGSGCPAVDQRGVSRPVGAACDRGAVEFENVTQRVYLPYLIRP